MGSLTKARVAQHGSSRVAWTALILVALSVPVAAYATHGAVNRDIASGPCASTAAPETNAIQSSLVGFLLRDDSLARSTRTSRLLPTAGGSNAVLVADTLTCRRLRRAIDSLSGLWSQPSLAQPDSTREIWVFSVDSMLVAVDLLSVRQENRSDWMAFRPSGIRVGQWR